MKYRVVIDFQCSQTLYETMVRNGFRLAKDGSGMQIKVSDNVAIPRRKVNAQFVKFVEPTSEEENGRDDLRSSAEEPEIATRTGGG